MSQPDSSAGAPPPPTKPRRKKYVRAVGPKLRRVLYVVLGGFALLALNGAYLSGVTIYEHFTGQTIQNYFYIANFLVHLVLGIAIVVPVIAFGIVHMRNSYSRPNRRAVVVGYALFAVSILLLASGIALTRGIVDLNDETARRIAYWTHVGAPVAAIWLFVLHRLAGPKLRWRVGVTWATVCLVFLLAGIAFHAQDPRNWNTAGPESGEQYFFPSLARTSTGEFIPAEVLDNDEYCQECHADVHDSWMDSAHHFSSFNNEAYLFSVRGTRKVALERDGDVQASRFCAGCHDPVPFFSGAFDDPNFDDVNHPTAHAGTTCTTCHAITNVNSPRGNADYTIEEPIHYPFTFSENSLLQWVNRQLVKAKPSLHKKTFLKDLHKTPEFCGTCHKVHLPEELNQYQWLRGQNHYDAHLLSGVSGHGVTSFYYPPKAIADCNTCHMKLQDSTDFGAKDFDGDGDTEVHDHLFPSANTAIAAMRDLPPEERERIFDRHLAFNDGVCRIDIFGIRKEARVDGDLTAPIRPQLPVLERGREYLVEIVLRTVKMGHSLTQGTTDSNELWIDVSATSDGRLIGRSGGVNDKGAVDPWSHYVRNYVIDRDGNRIDRRNAEDIFAALYNHQIPPGAGEVIHFRLVVPEDAGDSVTIDCALQYRKFDTTYLEYIYGELDANVLPVMTLATDRVTFPVEQPVGDVEAPDFPEWQRWNDYGIGLLRKGSKGSRKGELKSAEAAFAQVEALGRSDGPLNRARVYVKEGRLEDAVDALKRARTSDSPAPAWVVDWYTAAVNRQNGHLDDAIESYRRLVETRYPDAVARGFDFSLDYRVWIELGRTLVERSKIERGDDVTRELFLTEAVKAYDRALEVDPENAAAHFGLSVAAELQGNADKASAHRRLHEKYKIDDSAAGVAFAKARLADPAADHAAESVVIYDLQRDGRYERSVLEFHSFERAGEMK